MNSMQNKTTSLDIVIPSFRLQSEYLLPIIKLEHPGDVSIRYLIVADNPEAEIPGEILALIDNIKVLLFRNPENYGSSKSRNVGIDNSTAEWVLFLDDDIKPEKDLLFEYCKAIRENPNETGFFGKVIFPPPINSFTKGIAISGIPNMYTIADRIDYMKWYGSGNVMIKRSTIGNVRFKELFPKKGAGEEVDFFLSINKATGQKLRGVKNAIVHHGWWNNGKRDYKRFFRYYLGTPILLNIFPEYAYYTFPNVIESLFLGLIISVIFYVVSHSLLIPFCIFAGIIIGNLGVEFIRLVFTKSLIQSFSTIEVALIRASEDLGIFIMNLRTGKMFSGFCKYFDIFYGENPARIKYLKYWTNLKFLACFILPALLYYLLR